MRADYPTKNARSAPNYCDEGHKKLLFQRISYVKEFARKIHHTDHLTCGEPASYLVCAFEGILSPVMTARKKAIRDSVGAICRTRASRDVTLFECASFSLDAPVSRTA